MTEQDLELQILRAENKELKAKLEKLETEVEANNAMLEKLAKANRDFAANIGNIAEDAYQTQTGKIVKLVHCKECLYHSADTNTCSRTNWLTVSVGFCAWAERKD